MTASHEIDARTPRATRGLTGILAGAGIAFEVLPHRRTTTAEAEAHALGVAPAATGKTVVVRANDERVRVVVPASTRLSMERLAHVLGGEPELLTEAELAETYPMFDVGAVPPFGGPDDRVVVDAVVAQHHSVIVEAGSHELSLRVAPHDLIELVHAEVAEVAG